MRKLKLQVQISLDGYICGPNGKMDWMTGDWDEELKNYVKDLTEPVDTIILGRKLAEGFIPYWTSVLGQEEGAEEMVYTDKVVFTKTLEKSEWDRTVLAKGNLSDEIKALKMKDGGDIIVYGGAGFVSSLIKEGLIDEYHLFINPVAAGDGLTIFRGLESRQNLTLIQSKAYECGIIVLFYKPRN